VDFRRSKTRNDGRAVEIKRSRSFEIGAASQDVNCTQPGKNFLPRMPVSIAGSNRNHSEPGMHPFQLGLDLNPLPKLPWTALL
jgi:hypothetical protein